MSHTKEFKIFVNSQLHDAKWPKETCAVVSKDVFGTQIPFVVRNDQVRRRHAEQKLIDELKKYLEPKSVLPTERPVTAVPLKLFLNYSPCSECSSRLIGFIDDCKKKMNLQISLEVVFSGIYEIARPSCDRGECGKSHKKLSHVEANITGLKFLIEHGATLRTFDQGDWRELASILKVSKVSAKAAKAEKRKKEDICMRKDLEELLPELSLGR